MTSRYVSFDLSSLSSTKLNHPFSPLFTSHEWFMKLHELFHMMILWSILWYSTFVHRYAIKVIRNLWFKRGFNGALTKLFLLSMMGCYFQMVMIYLVYACYSSISWFLSLHTWTDLVWTKFTWWSLMKVSISGYASLWLLRILRANKHVMIPWK